MVFGCGSFGLVWHGSQRLGGTSDSQFSRVLFLNINRHVIQLEQSWARGRHAGTSGEGWWDSGWLSVSPQGTFANHLWWYLTLSDEGSWNFSAVSCGEIYITATFTNFRICFHLRNTVCYWRVIYKNNILFEQEVWIHGDFNLLLEVMWKVLMCYSER